MTSVTELMRQHDQKILRTPKKPKQRNVIGVIAPKRIGGNGSYQHVHESLAVDPEQVAEVRAVYKAAGLGDIEHTSDGSPIFTSAKQVQDAAKARGFKTGRDGYENLRTGRVQVEERRRLMAQLERLAYPEGRE